jgi:hypothetical protein
LATLIYDWAESVLLLNRYRRAKWLELEADFSPEFNA